MKKELEKYTIDNPKSGMQKQKYWEWLRRQRAQDRKEQKVQDAKRFNFLRREKIKEWQKNNRKKPAKKRKVFTQKQKQIIFEQWYGLGNFKNPTKKERTKLAEKHGLDYNTMMSRIHVWASYGAVIDHRINKLSRK